jgi:hypothetical protein
MKETTMRLAIPALALAVGLPLLGSSQGNAFFWSDDSYERPRYSYYGAGPQYYGERRYYRGLRHYRSHGRAERYRTGSQRWWRAMDEDDRGGRRR